MRVLVTSTPGTGHIHPVVPVALALRQAGHDVRWAVAADGAAVVARFGIPTELAGITLPERNVAFAPDAPRVMALAPRDRRAMLLSSLFGRVSAPAMRPALAELVTRWTPDLIVHEAAELAAAPVATARGIPHVTVAFSGMFPDAAIAATIDAVGPVWAAEGLDVPPDAGLLDHLYLHRFPPSFGQRPDAAAVCDVRPDAAEGPDEGPPRWLAGLGVDRPAVYVTFGTEMGPVAPWAAMLGGVGQLDVDVLATVGRSIDATALEPVPANVRVERYVPQALVLPRVAVVVSHAGAGTLLAAAAHGVAQVCLPIAADQWENADAATGAGVALTLEGDAVCADGVASAVGRALGDPAMAVAVARVAGELGSMPRPADHVDAIAALVGA